MENLRIGPLEAAVLGHLWARGTMSVKALHAALGVERGIKLNTVQSAVDRLYRKTLLDREKVSHAFMYSPSVTRAELRTRIIKQTMSQLAEEPSMLVSALVDYAEGEGDELLAELEATVAERRRQRTGNDE